jgi:glutaredoxin
MSGTASNECEQLGIVTMYKKDGCPYCQKAKALLEDKYGLKISFVDIESENRYVNILLLH